MLRQSYKTLRNVPLRNLTRALSTHASECRINVMPQTGLFDEKVEIRVDGLKPNQTVTLTANVDAKGNGFESRCVYRTDATGQISNLSCESVAGTFTGKAHTGLFWSLKPQTGEKFRYIQSDVTTPVIFHIKAYEGIHSSAPIAETDVTRWYKKPEVRRIPLTGKYKGVLFLPEGNGPFPGLIEMNGSMVKVIENRASLLASHGYATLALSYQIEEASPCISEFTYVQEACDWFSDLNYINKNRMGCIGTSYGGFLSLILASSKPQIKAVVNVNGPSVMPQPDYLTKCTPGWPNIEAAYLTEEGVDLRNCYDCVKPVAVPLWNHDAKILHIVGEDDRQVGLKWITYANDNCPESFKKNTTVCRYPGAGHLINPPYTPLLRALPLSPRNARYNSLIDEKFYDNFLLMGGYPEEQAVAQEDSWKKILHFFEKHLKSPFDY